ncbi:MAG TPA: Asp-tRNA(Asn)/Glu-tRNA(Gln) amidotransferase subunit GatC [Candidatus Wallbacteria bacterium]|nr:MAG: Aspartyl/glutamyl-tRNA(Asn/Gln) amidotransferase subunit C [bacterium ADurb.Bin243]HOD41676.1 Asp-tRNA(Asn)/Glu-tRNA(Gln) amidotransferase subunit GatC [Candidatus Wallbacteria bacterium]HPG58196.1 Asp-tRNA(Asn)/Glu-tRNA(Gln) amidotransferase subunit GatC [Candidatus Wallbacteria bacterium]
MISKEEITKIAGLAMLELSETEKTEYSSQLSSLLGYFKDIQSLDLAGVEPTNHALVADNVLREDTAAPSLGQKTVVAGAPATDGKSYRVPAIIETEEQP